MTPKQQACDLLAGYFGDTPGVPLGLVDRISDIIQANRLSNDMFGDANTERQKGVERIAELETDLKRTQNGAKETLHTLDGVTEKLAETRAALKVAKALNNEAIRREAGRQKAMECAVKAAGDWMSRGGDAALLLLGNALADLEKLDAK